MKQIFWSFRISQRERLKRKNPSAKLSFSKVLCDSPIIFPLSLRVHFITDSPLIQLQSRAFKAVSSLRVCILPVLSLKTKIIFIADILLVLKGCNHATHRITHRIQISFGYSANVRPTSLKKPKIQVAQNILFPTQL